MCVICSMVEHIRSVDRNQWNLTHIKFNSRSIKCICFYLKTKSPIMFRWMTLWDFFKKKIQKKNWNISPSQILEIQKPGCSEIYVLRHQINLTSKNCMGSPQWLFLYTPLFVDSLHALMQPALVIREFLVQKAGHCNIPTVICAILVQPEAVTRHSQSQSDSDSVSERSLSSQTAEARVSATGDLSQRKRATADWECAEKSYKDGPRTSKPRICRQTESD